MICGVRPEYTTMTDNFSEKDSKLGLKSVEDLLQIIGMIIEKRLSQVKFGEKHEQTASLAVAAVSMRNMACMIEELTPQNINPKRDANAGWSSLQQTTTLSIPWYVFQILSAWSWQTRLPPKELCNCKYC